MTRRVRNVSSTPVTMFGSDGTEGTTIKGSNVAHAHAVTPADGTDLTGVAAHGAAQFLYVGTAGDVGILTGGEVLLFTGLAAGVWHPLPPFTRVRTTGLTADDLIAGY